MRLFAIAGLALATLGLGACGTVPLTGNLGADAKTAAANVNNAVASATDPTTFATNLKAMNDTLGQFCGGYGNLDWNPPLPPTGSLHAQCAFGKQPTTLGLPASAIGTPGATSVPGAATGAPTTTAQPAAPVSK